MTLPSTWLLAFTISGLRLAVEASRPPHPLLQPAGGRPRYARAQQRAIERGYVVVGPADGSMRSWGMVQRKHAAVLQGRFVAAVKAVSPHADALPRCCLGNAKFGLKRGEFYSRTLADVKTVRAME